MKRRAAAAFLIVGICLLSAAAVQAKEAAFELRAGDSVKSILESHVGKPVTILLSSGQEMSGVVAAVVDHMIHLSKLAGRDFYDAAVALEDVSGVILKVRGK